MSADSPVVAASVPVPYRGRVLTQANQVIAIGLFVLQILLTFVGSFVPAVLGVFVGQALFPNDAQLSFLPILAGMGLTAGMLWLLVGRVLRHPWSSAYLFARTQAEFRQRPDPLVDPNDPEAILVEVIPRRNWMRSWGSTEDLGFLRVDEQKHELLFEGDKKCYRVPTTALIASEVEMANKDWDQDSRSVPVALVVVTFRDPELGEREVPFRPMRAVSGDPLGGNYVERANALQRQILTLFAAEESALAPEAGV